MADPVSLSVAPVLKIALDEVYAVIRERFHMFYGIKENVKDLECKLKEISDVLQDAESKQMNNGGVKNWLSELTQAAYDAEDILERWATECKLRKMKQEVSKSFTTSVSAYKVRSSTYRWAVAKTIKEISERLSKIENLTTLYNFQTNPVVFPRARNNSRETASFINNIDIDVVGREADKENLIKLLVADDEPSVANSSIPVIPIVGMGGLGKTTLARLIYNDERITGRYEFRIWVCVTENFDSTQILKDMIIDNELRRNINSLSKDQLENRLRESISGKRFLLVLDDVWSTNYNDEWAPIQRLLNEGGRGSKILVTTRDEKVSKNMGTPEPYLLQFLPYDECWNLFERLTFKNGTPQDLKSYGEEIVRKCKGLPLAVVQMGALLRLYGITDTIKWKKIAESEIWKLEGEPSNSNADADRPKILPALILSYDHLSPNLKHCFAYCSIFPKAYEFDKVELVKLWMAEKYIPLSSKERVEDTGNEYFDDLLMRFFFQPSANDNKRYMMHDLIHDLAQYVSSTNCCQVKDRTASGISEATRHVSFIYENVEEPLLNLIIHNSKKLRTLLLPGRNLKTHGKSLDKMFHTLRYIRVLDLSSSTLLSLPKSIKFLTLLRYLDLSKNEIKNLPNSICNLYNLQTLKLIGCPWIFELPKDFGNLINLRHLELDEMFWYKSSSLPQRIGRLTGLYNLQAFLVGDKSGYEIGQLENMVNLTGTLSISNLEYAKNAGKAMLQGKERLRKVVLKWTNRGLNVKGDGEADEKVLEDLQPHFNVEQLQIYHYLGSKFPDWVRSGQLQNLVSIRLYHCTKCEILSLGALPHLSELYIKGMHELKEWRMGSPYPSLNKLHITDCPKMKELPSNFPTTRVLKIKSCKALKALPTAAQLMVVILVDNQVLEEWNEHQLIVSSETIEGETRMTSSLLNLLEVKIINCPAMQTLPEIFSPQKLELTGCRLLCSLPDPMFTKRLQCLKLDSFDDPTLMRSIPDSETLYSLIISNISNLTSLPKWPNLPNLQALYIHDCRDLISLSEQDDESWKSLTSLKLLSIQNCPQLVTFPPDGFPEQLQFFSISSCSSLKSFGSKDIFKTLIALKDLYIEDCLSLMSLPEDGVSTSLQHLCIQGCPSLTKQFRNKVGDWLKIEHILDLEIETVPVDTSPSASAAWYHRGFRCIGTDVMDTVQPRQRPKLKGSTQRVDKANNSESAGEPKDSLIEAQLQQSVDLDEKEVEEKKQHVIEKFQDVLRLKTEPELSKESVRPEFEQYPMFDRQRQFLSKRGLGLTQSPDAEEWFDAEMIDLMDNELSNLPDEPICPKLYTLSLRQNYKLRKIPSTFFTNMPLLQLLDLSNTSIMSVPKSVFELAHLKRLYLMKCEFLMVLPPEVGKLKRLEVLDMEGTEIFNLPVEIQELSALRRLRVSLYACIHQDWQSSQSNSIIPFGVISALSTLQEVNIGINPDDARWDACVETIMKEVGDLSSLKILMFYFPKVELLRELETISPSLSDFRFIVGRHSKSIIRRLPNNIELELERLGLHNRYLKYINGEGIPEDIKKVLKHATVFQLDRHMTVKKLTEFGIENMEHLKGCLLGECNEMQVIIDGNDIHNGQTICESFGDRRIGLEALEFMYIYYMKNLKSVWEGPVDESSLSLLKSLTLSTCPQLITIFTVKLLENLHSLEELTVRDCPAIKSLVSCEEGAKQSDYYLPKLRTISLHYVPELASISSEVWFAPQLREMSLYICPKLKSLSIKEVSSKHLEKIIGETDWWEALEWKQVQRGQFDRIFVPINADTCFK